MSQILLCATLEDMYVSSKRGAYGNDDLRSKVGRRGRSVGSIGAQPSLPNGPLVADESADPDTQNQHESVFDSVAQKKVYLPVACHTIAEHRIAICRHRLARVKNHRLPLDIRKMPTLASGYHVICFFLFEEREADVRNWSRVTVTGQWHVLSGRIGCHDDGDEKIAWIGKYLKSCSLEVARSRNQGREPKGSRKIKRTV